MANAFTQYWRNDTWKRERVTSNGQAFDHTAGNQFIERGMNRGDHLYIVTNIDGKMYVAGRMTVDKIVSQKIAERVLKHKLWDAEEHVLGSEGTSMNFDLQVPNDVIKQLRFGNDEPLRFTRRASLDDQTLRGVRRLTPKSAALLDDIIGTGGEGLTKVKLVKVKTLDELSENFIRFQQSARHHVHRTKRIFLRTEYWVRDENSGAFGPGKFLGYRDMDFATYEQAGVEGATGAKFNGGIAKLNIEEALGVKFRADDSLEAECRTWGVSLLGASAWGGASAHKWKFLTIPIPGREPTSDFPNEITQPEKFIEGALTTVNVNVYERSREARKKCIQHHGTCCAVCGMNFSERYREIGEGFIHVHHLRSLAGIDEEYEVDPIKDLRPVCPNCHAMLHWKSPEPRSIEYLKGLLR